jgi:hypothetical protein
MPTATRDAHPRFRHGRLAAAVLGGGCASSSCEAAGLVFSDGAARRDPGAAGSAGNKLTPSGQCGR